MDKDLRRPLRLSFMSFSFASSSDAPGPDDGEMDGLGEQLAEIEMIMAEHEGRSESLVDEVSATRERSSQLSNELNDVRSSLQQQRGRQASLEALQQAAMEDGSAEVGEWLQAQQLADKPRLLEQLQVDDGWQLAVETVLGEYLQAVCVDDLGALGQMLGSLEQGSIALVDATAETPVAADYLASRVHSQGRAASLLKGIKVAEDLGQAMAMRSSLAEGESIITREGVWLGRNWLLAPNGPDSVPTPGSTVLATALRGSPSRWRWYLAPKGVT